MDPQGAKRRTSIIVKSGKIFVIICIFNSKGLRIFCLPSLKILHGMALDSIIELSFSADTIG
jgi:hypothetical protein